MREIALGRDWALGDAFLLNGLNRFVAQRYDRVWITSFPRYMETNLALYANTNIHVTVSHEKNIGWSQDTWRDMLVSMNIPIVEVDLWEKRPKDTIWYRWYYDQLNIPFSYHKSLFKLPPISDHAYQLAKQFMPSSSYKVVHDNTGSKDSYPLEIDDNLPIVYIRPGITNNILDFVLLLQNASEIHVTWSSVFWLVKCMEDNLNAKLFLHDIRLTNDPPDYKDLDPNKWTIYNYPNKM